MVPPLRLSGAAQSGEIPLGRVQVIRPERIFVSG
jgi:hypothetical protein